jgi:hypothetical protein
MNNQRSQIMSSRIHRIYIGIGDIFFEILDSAYALWYAIRPRPEPDPCECEDRTVDASDD